MGLFSINMPLLYGEGRRAFARLQEEILKQSTDLSILAWNNPLLDRRGLESILARSPDDFAECSKILFAPSDLQRFAHTTITMTNAGLRIENSHLIHGFEGSPGVALSLECRDADDITKVLGLKLQALEFSNPTSIDLQQQQQGRELLCYIGWKEATKAETRLISANFSEPKRLSSWSSVTISREFKIVPSTHQSPMTQQLLIPSMHTHVWVQLPPGSPSNYWTVSKLYREEFWNVQDYTFQFDERISANSEPSTYSEEWSYGAISLVETVPGDFSRIGLTITFARKLELTNNGRQSEIYVKLGFYRPDSLPRGKKDFVFGDHKSAFSNDETHSLSLGINRKLTVRVETLHRLGLCIAHLLMQVEETPEGDLNLSPSPVYNDAEEILMI
jgi:hypothetical protein